MKTNWIQRILNRIAAFQSEAQGLVYYGVVTNIPGANQFDVALLAGKGDTYFDDFIVYVIRDTGGAGAAPEGEFQTVTAYLTAGTFTHTAFSAALGVGDEVLLLHPSLITQVYGDALWFDDTNGVTGDTIPVGSMISPSNSEANIYGISLRLPIRRIRIRGTFLVPMAMEKYEFIGQGVQNVDKASLNNQDVDNSVFRNLQLFGGKGGISEIRAIECTINGVSNFAGMLERCLIFSLTCRDASNIDLLDCSAYQVGATINTGGAPTTLNLFGWKGSLTLTSLTGGTVNIYASGANITIQNTCTGGTINIYGVAKVTDNSGGGCTVTDYTVDTVTAAIKTQTDKIAGKMLFTMDFWSDPQEEVQLAAIAASPVFTPTVTVADLPGDAAIVRAAAMFKFRMVENTYAGVNSLDGATNPDTSQVIQIKEAAGAYIDAINFVNLQFSLAEATREGGDVLIGSENIVGEVDVNGVYTFRWLLGKAVADFINFNDVQVGLRIWYSV